MAQAFPATFTTLQAKEPRPVPIRIRDDLDQETGAEVVEAIRAVGWSGLVHAYGAATDVEDQLIAAAVGDEATRKAAWWDLWGNIHHQGTIYEATVAAVPLIGRLAAWRSYPDRPEAISRSCARWSRRREWSSGHRTTNRDGLRCPAAAEARRGSGSGRS